MINQNYIIVVTLVVYHILCHYNIIFHLHGYIVSCDPTCKNGGTCDESNACLCVPGYLGNDCSTEGMHLQYFAPS